MVETTKRAAAPAAAAENRVDAQRRRLFCGLMASGSLLFVTPDAAAAVSDAKAAEAGSEVGTVWWTELVSRDVQRASNFYSKVMGWQTKIVDTEDGSRPAGKDDPTYTLFLANGNDVAGAKPIDDDLPLKNPTWLTYFQVDNVDAAIARAVAAGGSVIVQPFNAGNAARMAVVADTEGNPVGLAHPL
ncbi:MAG: VOC family protein [Bacteroidota bacterium]|jgi:predicted enzyme related to lactoylglutathione lyase